MGSKIRKGLRELGTVGYTIVALEPFINFGDVAVE